MPLRHYAREFCLHYLSFFSDTRCISGNVQIFHEGRWGNICDDEWDEREGEMVCTALGFPGLEKVTYSGVYGRAAG